uniref:Uncharacterized protein n=1 Tax=Rhizophora mucronata TaxID=61149 RepID=A0A2P2Q138_RHIMU
METCDDLLVDFAATSIICKQLTILIMESLLS